MMRKRITSLKRALRNEQISVELMLIVCSLGLTSLIASLQSEKLVVLNLFYFPVILGGFFLGRYRAGLMALLCVIAASLVVAHRPSDFASSGSSIAVGLSMLVWGAALCLAALVVGSLSDERNAKVEELHTAYVGVVEVLSKYLQSANPRLKDRSKRVVELCQNVAAELHLPPQQIDDIRVAALMLDLGRIEVTTRLISRAVDTLESNPEPTEEFSFHGMDLVHSLGSVLKGAIPLLAGQGDAVYGMICREAAPLGTDSPIGAKVIRLVRAYDALAAGTSGQDSGGPQQALHILARDPRFKTDASILAALRRTIVGHRELEYPMAMAK